MARLDSLLAKYRQAVSAPWAKNVAAPQRVIFLVYDPTDELKLRLKLDEFALATKEAGHAWHRMDLTDAFAAWMSKQEYREEYFQDPTNLMLDQNGDLESFSADLIQRVRSEAIESADAETVFALSGVASLFGCMHISRLLESTKNSVKGRYLVFFPGELRGNSYRILDARDGWDYLAVPITCDEY